MINPVLLKFFVFIVVILGVWVTFYEDENIKVEAKLVSFNAELTEITLTVRVENKMDTDITIRSVTYSVYADQAKTILITQGSVGNVYLPAGEATERSYTVTVENLDQIHDQVYFVADVSYLMDGGLYETHIDRSFDTSLIGG